MLEHDHSVHTDSKESHLPNQSFFSWLKGQTALFISQFLGLAGVLYVLGAVPYYLKSSVKDVPGIFKPENIQDFIIYAHIPFLLLFIVSLLNIIDSNDSGSFRSSLVYERIFDDPLRKARLRKGKIQLRRFKIYFLFFWILMLVLYSSFIVQINHERNDKLPDKSKILAGIEKFTHLTDKNEILDNIKEIKSLVNKQKVKDFVAKSNEEEKKSKFVEGITKIQQLVGGEPDDNVVHVMQDAYLLINENMEISKNWWDAFNFKVFEFFIFTGNNLSLLFIFWCFTVLAIPWYTRKHIIRAKRIRITATVIMLLITAFFPAFLSLSKVEGVYYAETVNTYVVYMNALSGLINAVVLALFIARLDSKLVGLRSYLVSVLYGYSAIQPLFVVFEEPGEIAQMIKAFVLIVVFIFKIYFFLIIVYAMQTGRLLDYLICFPKLFGRVDSIFANQFQIDTHTEESESYIVEGKTNKVEIKPHREEIYKFSIRNREAPVYFGCEHYKKEEYKKKAEEIKKLMKNKKLYKSEESCGTYTVAVFWDEEYKNKIFTSVDLKSQDEAKDLIIASVVNIPYCKVNYS